MCDSDDTDFLLLIPPDFFQVASTSDDSMGPPPRPSNIHKTMEKYQTKMVNKLMSQVNTLQNRLSAIESQSESLDNSLKTPKLTPTRRTNQRAMRRSRSNQNDEAVRKSLFTGSLQTTPKKSLRQHQLRSFPSTPSSTDDDRRRPTLYTPSVSTIISSRYDPSGKSFDSLNISPQKQPLTEIPPPQNHMCDDRRILREIDTFLRSVDCIKTHLDGNKGDSSASSLDLSFVRKPEFRAIAEKHFNRKIIDDNQALKIKKIRKIPRKSENQTPDSTPFSSPDKRKQENSTIESTTLGSTISMINDERETQSDNLTELSGFKAKENLYPKLSMQKPNVPSEKDNIKDTLKKALYVLNNLREVDASSETEIQHNDVPNNEISNEPKLRQEAINSASDRNNTGSNKSTCNNSIEELIPNTLVSLSYLWGASRKDIEKCSTGESSVQQRIEEERLRREHCEKLIEALQQRLLEAQERLSVAIKVDAVKDEALVKLKDACLLAQNRCKQIQDEKTTAMENLKTFQMRNEDNEKRIKKYEEDIRNAMRIEHELRTRIEELENERTKSLDENKQLRETVYQLQTELEKEKQFVNDIRQAANETKQIFVQSQSEIDQLRQQRQTLQDQLNELKGKNAALEERITKYSSLIEASQKNEAKLILEKQNLTTEIEHTKTELRSFYQRQLDNVVKEKLAEFQEQLDSAEKALDERLSKAKLEVAQSAAQLMHETVQKHQLEIRLLEERHTEETRLLNFKRRQMEQTIESFRYKLHRQNLNRAKLASKLHELMEAQWREAIRIVTTNGSPAGSEISLIKPDSTINIHDFIETNLVDNDYDVAAHYNKPRPHSAPQEIPTSDKFNTKKPTRMIPGQSINSENDSDNPFGKDNQATCRLATTQTNGQKSEQTYDTPLTTKPLKSGKQSFTQTDLQKYITMLMNQPSKPLTAQGVDSKMFNNEQKDKSKPPWK